MRINPSIICLSSLFTALTTYLQKLMRDTNHCQSLRHHFDSYIQQIFINLRLSLEAETHVVEENSRFDSEQRGRSGSETSKQSFSTCDASLINSATLRHGTVLPTNLNPSAPIFRGERIIKPTIQSLTEPRGETVLKVTHLNTPEPLTRFLALLRKIGLDLVLPQESHDQILAFVFAALRNQYTLKVIEFVSPPPVDDYNVFPPLVTLPPPCHIQPKKLETAEVTQVLP